ncbi:hypothetical protein LTR70_006848 [Exophiala xenobiotica]|uniref:CENP-V/GFA domain-containing protein n=1 Tax=Lithohypha guttulata TaxID=1690604 RepID=A0ABR0K5Y8_9EURO|nr:hypothetical protein LTR24_006457 [Lithohypha guttulata]KAK5315195.1 hypothetical protein LTR70_006848 [Exophiala xenobiotica]
MSDQRPTLPRRTSSPLKHKSTSQHQLQQCLQKASSRLEAPKCLTLERPRLAIAEAFSSSLQASTSTGYTAAKLVTNASQPTEGEDLVDTFICNCTDCHKITASMFASNFTINDSALEHLRGQEKLTVFSQNKTIGTGNTMSNYFCSVCGTLMYRRGTGFPGQSILRIGTVDDFSLHATELKPRIERFVKDRVSWFKGGEGVQQVQGYYYG